MITLILLILIAIEDSVQVECRKCKESPLLPGRKGCNATCTGEYCYRAVKNISDFADEHAAILDCFDFPLEQLKLGCRRNFEEIVLCVCKTDMCNENEATNIADLPVVDDCIDQTSIEGFTYGFEIPRQCRANYCIRRRNALVYNPEAGFTITNECPVDHLLSRVSHFKSFDLFIRSNTFFVPVGMCVKVQIADKMVMEVCSCPQSKNCSTSTKYPSDSDLPIDKRTTGFIACSMYNPTAGVKRCDGHACFILQDIYGDKYGCLTYGEGFEDRKFPLGAHRVVDANLFLCAEKLCNQKEAPSKLFGPIPHLSNDSSCNCLQPASTSATAVTNNQALILGISIPSAIIVVFACALTIHRFVTGKWYFLPFRTGKGRITTVVTVVSPSAHLKNK